MDYTWSSYEESYGSDLSITMTPPKTLYPDVIQTKQNGQNCEKKLCLLQSTKHQIQEIEKFTHVLLTIAKKCIPKIVPPSKKKYGSIQDAKHKKKVALSKFKHQLIINNLIEYKHQREKKKL